MLKNHKNFVNCNFTRSACMKYLRQCNTNPLVSSCVYLNGVGIYVNVCVPKLEKGRFKGFQLHCLQNLVKPHSITFM